MDSFGPSALTRMRPLLAAVMCCLVALACAASAEASSYGSFNSDGLGHIYAYSAGALGNTRTQVYEPLGLSSAQAGLNLAVYSADGTTAILYGTRGAAFTPDPNNRPH